MANRLRLKEEGVRRHTDVRFAPKSGRKWLCRGMSAYDPKRTLVTWAVVYAGRPALRSPSSRWFWSSAPVSPPRLPLKETLVTKTVFSCWSAYAGPAIAVSSAAAEVTRAQRANEARRLTAHSSTKNAPEAGPLRTPNPCGTWFPVRRRRGCRGRSFRAGNPRSAPGP